MTELDFVNDWSELEAAVEYFKDVDAGHGDCDPDYCDEYELLPNAQAIIKYVPRLLTQYATLLELSFALTDKVADHEALKPQTGLYLPGNS